MLNETLTGRLSRFIEFVMRGRAVDPHSLTVLDLRLECRVQRLREYADWPNSELDLIEREAASYDDHTNLAAVLSGSIKPQSTDSWLHSPSLCAWT